MEGGPIPKRARLDGGSGYQPVMYLRLPSSASEGERSESENSYQGMETEYCKDSSDINTSELYSDSDVFKDEFEIASYTEERNPFESDGSSSSSVQDIRIITVDLEVESEGGWADQESTEDSDLSSSDSELSEKDNWVCQRKGCTARNRPPRRFCNECYSVRKNWLPERRKPRRRPRRPKTKLTGLEHLPCNPTLKKDISSATTDSGVGMSSQENFPGTQEEPMPSCSWAEPQPSQVKSEDVPDGTSLVKMSSQASVVSNSPHSSSAMKASQDVDDPPRVGLCKMCQDQPRDACIVHGKLGHQVYCYSCAKKLWKSGQRCPICRDRIERVVKNIFS